MTDRWEEDDPSGAAGAVPGPRDSDDIEALRDELVRLADRIDRGRGPR
ncbi:hypothetical protein ACE14D_05865 [Streptomyces sp. Act-28]